MATTKRKAAKAKKQPKGRKPTNGKPNGFTPREGSKTERLVAAMKSAKGISTDEAAKEFDWETKSIRGVISGVLRKKMGLTIDTVRDEKRGNVYRIK